MVVPMKGYGIFELYRQMAGELTARETALIAAPDPLAGRPPTPAESAAHTAEIDRILTGRPY
jgi:hypothetical protein